MPLRLDIRKKLSSRSDRVKAIDLHPTEPWVCASLYNGNVHIWNIESQQLIKTFEVCSAPVRAIRFVPRMNWIVVGSDNQCVRLALILFLCNLFPVFYPKYHNIIVDCVQLQYAGTRAPTSGGAFGLHTINCSSSNTALNSNLFG